MSAAWLNASTDAKVKLLTRQYLLLRDDRDQVQERIDQVADQLVTLLGIGGTCELAPSVGVRVQAGSRQIDKKRAAQVLSQEELLSISKIIVDVAALRERYPLLVDQLLLPPSRPTLRMLAS